VPAEFIVGAVIGAAAASTHIRKAVRRGLIYGVGSVIVAYDKLAAGAHAVVQSARETTNAPKDAAATSANGSPATAPNPSPPVHPAAASPAAGTPA
jgi:hypothetical protein